MIDKMKTKAKQAKEYIKSHPIEAVGVAGVVTSAVLFTTATARAAKEAEKAKDEIRLAAIPPELQGQHVVDVNESGITLPFGQLDTLRKYPDYMYTFAHDNHVYATQYYGDIPV